MADEVGAHAVRGAVFGVAVAVAVALVPAATGRAASDIALSRASPSRGSSATHLYFACGANLCVARMAGRNLISRSHLTTDGTSSVRYSSPSISRAGTRLAFIYGNTVYAADASRTRNLHVNTALAALMRPDGARVAAINEQTEASGYVVPYLVDVNFDGSGYENASRYVKTAGWFGDRLLRDDQPATRQAICVVRSDGTCGRDVASDPKRDLWDPAVSPDGRLVAVTSAPPGRVAGRIALYSTSSGHLVRNLTGGTTDSHPTWSPDGKTIAFSRGTSIYEVPTAGGTARAVASGRTPSWGG